MAQAKARIKFIGEESEAFEELLQRWDYRTDSVETDLHQVLTEFSETLEKRINQCFHEHGAIKVDFVVTAEFKSDKYKEYQSFPIYLRSSKYLIYQSEEVATTVAKMNQEIQSRNENAVRNESQLKIIRIDYLTIMVSQFHPLSGRRYKALPEFLKKKRAIINVENKDNRCFGYAILAALVLQEKPVSKALKANPSRPSLYQKSFQKYGLYDIEYPVEPERMLEMENKLNLKINVFSFYDDEGQARFPLFISKRQHYAQEIDLLYWDEHYGWIKSFSAFIFDLSPSHSTKYFCKRCFGVFFARKR